MTNRKGITLVSLIITIIVILILSTLVLSLITSDNSILVQTYNAKKINYESGLKEKIDLVIAEFEIQALSSKNPSLTRQEIVTEENLNQNLKEIGKIKENSLVNKEDGTISFVVITNKNNSELEYTYKSSR